MIISISYQVRSRRGIQFRKWAREYLNEYEYLVKDFAMVDRLKEMRNFEQDYIFKTTNTYIIKS